MSRRNRHGNKLLSEEPRAIPPQAILLGQCVPLSTHMPEGLELYHCSKLKAEIPGLNFQRSWKCLFRRAL